MLDVLGEFNEAALELTGVLVEELVGFDCGALSEGILAQALAQPKHHGSDLHEESAQDLRHSEPKVLVVKTVRLGLRGRPWRNNFGTTYLSIH